MPPSAQEARCIELACGSLCKRYGGTWEIVDDLDLQYPTEPSPEVRVSNGKISAAIEVKGLTGDSEFNSYVESIFSLKKYLAPSCGGYYYLNPALNFRLPMEPRFRRYVKREIERVAPTLAPETSGAIRIPREAYVSLANPTGPGFIYCCHTPTEDVVREVSPRLIGAFLLVDEGQWEHSFVTEEAKQVFQDALVEACQRRIDTGRGVLTWTEEWQLTRGNEAGANSGVWVIAVTDARDVYASVTEAVDLMLEAALRKFEERRWADIHVIVFDNQGVMMTADRVAAVAIGFQAEELQAVDLILLADNDSIVQVWPT